MASDEPVDLAYVLGQALELRTLGYNLCYAEDCEKAGTWPGPVSAHDYKRAAQRIEALIRRARRQVKPPEPEPAPKARPRGKGRKGGENG